MKGFKEELIALMEKYEVEINVETEDMYTGSTIEFYSNNAYSPTITVPTEGVVTSEDIKKATTH